MNTDDDVVGVTQEVPVMGSVDAAGEMLTRQERRSCGSAARSTSPASSSRASTRVTVGRCTRSRSASSDGVSGPWRSIVASAAVWDGLSSGARLLAQPARHARDVQAQAGGEVGEGSGTHG